MIYFVLLWFKFGIAVLFVGVLLFILICLSTCLLLCIWRCLVDVAVLFGHVGLLLYLMFYIVFLCYSNGLCSFCLLLLINLWCSLIIFVMLVLRFGVNCSCCFCFCCLLDCLLLVVCLLGCYSCFGCVVFVCGVLDFMSFELGCCFWKNMRVEVYCFALGVIVCLLVYLGGLFYVSVY